MPEGFAEAGGAVGCFLFALDFLVVEGLHAGGHEAEQPDEEGGPCVEAEVECLDLGDDCELKAGEFALLLDFDLGPGFGLDDFLGFGHLLSLKRVLRLFVAH